MVRVDKFFACFLTSHICVHIQLLTVDYKVYNFRRKVILYPLEWHRKWGNFDCLLFVFNIIYSWLSFLSFFKQSNLCENFWVYCHHNCCVCTMVCTMYVKEKRERESGTVRKKWKKILHDFWMESVKSFQRWRRAMISKEI